MEKLCDYCGKPLSDIGNGKGTPHKVFKSDERGWPTNKEITTIACLTCEMEFDED